MQTWCSLCINLANHYGIISTHYRSYLMPLIKNVFFSDLLRSRQKVSIAWHFLEGPNFSIQVFLEFLSCRCSNFRLFLPRRFHFHVWNCKWISDFTVNNWMFFQCFWCYTNIILFLGNVKWQCALNLEQYEIAQQLRNKLTEVRLFNSYTVKCNLLCYSISDSIYHMLLF